MLRLQRQITGLEQKWPEQLKAFGTYKRRVRFDVVGVLEPGRPL